WGQRGRRGLSVLSLSPPRPRFVGEAGLFLGKGRGSRTPPPPPLSSSAGRGLPPRPLAGRRRDQLTKATDYGAVLVAITVAQFYLSAPHPRSAAPRPAGAKR